MRILRNNIIFWLSVIALILLSYWWRLKTLNIFPFSYDEGIHLILGKLWAAGHTPYQEIFVSYPPIFMWSLGVPWKIFGQAGALQLLMTTYALAGVIAVIYLATVYDSKLAGITAGVILSFTPDYFISSFSIMTEAPSISIVVAAIALAEKYRRGGGWIWALLTGLMLGFGLSLKILPYYAVPMVAAMIISRHLAWGQDFVTRLQASKWRIFQDLAILGGGSLITFLLPIFLFDLSAFYDQVIGMRLSSRAVDINPFESNNDYIRDFLFGNPGIMALALYGFVFVVAKDLRRYWVLVTCFVLIWISMYFLVPLRGKHLPIFLPIVAVFAGFAVHHIYLFVKQITRAAYELGLNMRQIAPNSRSHAERGNELGVIGEKLSPRSVAMALIILVTLGMFGWNVPNIIANNNGQTLKVKENKERLAAIKFIDKIATPDDCVIADNPVFLYQTNRLPPPELSETSQTRIDTGHLTLPDVIQAIETYNCHVVAVVTPRFGESVPGLPEWLAENYLGLHAQNETFVYFALKGRPEKETGNNYTPVQSGSFGGVVQVYGVQLSDQAWSKEEKRIISLYWQLESPLEVDYVEQITLQDVVSNKQVYQVKRTLFEGQFNPTAWRIDEQARDTFWLDFPTDLPAGSYDMYLALCTPETERCLSIDNQGQTQLHLGQITLQP